MLCLHDVNETKAYVIFYLNDGKLTPRSFLESIFNLVSIQFQYALTCPVHEQINTTRKFQILDMPLLLKKKLFYFVFLSIIYV